MYFMFMLCQYESGYIMIYHIDRASWAMQCTQKQHQFGWVIVGWSCQYQRAKGCAVGIFFCTEIDKEQLHQRKKKKKKKTEIERTTVVFQSLYLASYSIFFITVDIPKPFNSCILLLILSLFFSSLLELGLVPLSICMSRTTITLSTISHKPINLVVCLSTRASKYNRFYSLPALYR